MGFDGNVPITRGIRELDHRTSNGIDVQLLWLPSTNRLRVAVRDEHADRSFEFAVEPADALAAFHHPYAYASDEESAHALLS